jgi:hypothetical protein
MGLGSQRLLLKAEGQMPALTLSAFAVDITELDADAIVDPPTRLWLRISRLAKVPSGG